MVRGSTYMASRSHTSNFYISAILGCDSEQSWLDDEQSDHYLSKISTTEVLCRYVMFKYLHFTNLVHNYDLCNEFWIG